MKLEGIKLLLAAVAACAALLLPAVAAADDDREVRKTGTCTATSQISLRLRLDEDEIRVEVEIRARQRGARWNVVLLRERRIVFRGVVRSGDDSRTAKLRREVDDWFGRNAIAVRASGPRGESCRVSAAI